MSAVVRFPDAEVGAERRGDCTSPPLTHEFMQYAVCSLSVHHTYSTGAVWSHMHRLHCSTLLPSPRQSVRDSFHARASLLWFFFFMYSSALILSCAIFLLLYLSFHHFFSLFGILKELCTHDEVIFAHTCIYVQVSACKINKDHVVTEERRRLWGYKLEGDMNGVECKGI